jgi:transmembrane sensor
MKSEEQMQELVTAQALEWFVAHRAGELTDEQREDFINWLSASPAHVREYLVLTGFGEDLKTLAKDFPLSTDALVARAQSEPPSSVSLLFPARETKSTLGPATKIDRRFTWKIAAAVAMTTLALALLGTWRLFEPNSYSTAHAEQRSWRMPDGSIVHLNSGSKIKVRFDDRRREVDLIQGQALFQVAKDARRPFWVRAGDATVKAVGTEFDVYRQPHDTVISVIEGRVAVWDSTQRINESIPSTAPVTQLDAGQQARVGRKSASVSRHPEDVRKTVAWLQRQVVFDHDPLASAAAEFNRYSETRILIEDPSLTSVQISGIFSAYDTEAFIRFLEHQPDMRVQRGDREIIVTPAIVK